MTGYNVLSEVICILPKEKEAHYMQFKTVETDRKKVVKAIAEFLGEAFKYAGPPTFAYKIGEVTVDREGTITIEDEQKGEALMAELTEQGFMGRTETEQTEDAHTAVKITLEGMTPHQESGQPYSFQTVPYQQIYKNTELQG